jgi:hypothetical protein
MEINNDVRAIAVKLKQIDGLNGETKKFQNDMELEDSVNQYVMENIDQNAVVSDQSLISRFGLAVISAF